MSLVVNMDNSISIQAALHEVVVALALAFVSVLVVIYAFLGSLRATLIPAITIPVSIIATFTAMYALGYTINVLTLLALVLAIGLVVDDAIVVLENIFRRAEEGEATVVAASNGSKEIGFAVIATTLTLAAVFIPAATGIAQLTISRPARPGRAAPWRSSPMPPRPRAAPMPAAS